MKTFMTIFLLSVMSATLLAACSPSEATSPINETALDYTGFTGKDVAVITGLLTYDTTKAIGANPVNYNDSASAAEDVRLGRVAGFMHTLTAVQVMAAQMDGFEAIPVPKDIFFAQVAAISHDEAAINRFNAFLASAEADGTLDDMRSRWFGTGHDLDAPLPEIPGSGETGDNGVLKVAICSDSIPYVYMGAGGGYSGFSVELMLRFGAHEGLGVEFSDMDFGGLIPYIVSEKADLGIANMVITEERKQSVLFTEPFFDEQHGILAPGAESAEPVRFSQWVITGIERNLIADNRWKMIVDGLGVTMTISLLAQFFGTVLGCFVCWLLTRKCKAACKLGSLYCGLVRAMPIVVLLMIAYYIIFGGTSISNVFVAVVAFTMTTGANVAQNLKGAIDAVDPVEIEAARSLGFTATGTFLTVTLPQAVRRAMPAYTTGFVELVKTTAIVGYIAIQDLTRAGDIIRSRTYDAYFPLLFVALIYLAVTTLCVQIFKAIIKKINSKEVARLGFSEVPKR